MVLCWLDAFVFMFRSSCICQAVVPFALAFTSRRDCIRRRQFVSTQPLRRRSYIYNAYTLSRTTVMATDEPTRDFGVNTTRSTSCLKRSSPALSIEENDCTPKTTSNSTTQEADFVARPNGSCFSSSQKNRFHQDMRRVLESRRNYLQSHYNLQDRRERPSILENPNVDGAIRVTHMLQHLKSIQSANEESFQIVLEAFVQRGRLRWYQSTTTTNNIQGNKLICAADQAEILLEELKQFNLENNISTPISIGTYNLVLQALATCSTPRGDRGYADRSLDLLQEIRENHPNENIPPETLLYVLHALCWQQPNLGPPVCAKEAYKVFQEIESLTSDPNVIFRGYQFLLEAWSKSATDFASDQARYTFECLKELSTDNEELQIDAEDFSNIILSCAKTKKKEATAVECEALLMNLIRYFKEGKLREGSEPTLIAFNAVIGVWSVLARGDRAMKILNTLEDLSHDCAKLQPDIVSYNSVLQAHLRNKHRSEGLERAIDLVSVMEERSLDQPLLRPNALTLFTLMKCWIQSGHPDAPMEAHRILQKIIAAWEGGDNSVEASNRPFNMIINAYAKSRDPSSTQKAVLLFERMKKTKEFKPDIITVTSLIECLSKTSDLGGPLKAESLLNEAFLLYESGDMKMKPNSRAFAMTILTFANKQGDTGRARALLDRLVELHDTTGDSDFKPSEYVYNYVLKCAANPSDDRLESFRIAARTYQEMRNSSIVRPDSFTYAFWLKCCNSLLPQNELKEKCVSHAFNECKKDGLVAPEVLGNLVQGNPSGLVSNLLSGTHHTVSSACDRRPMHLYEKLPEEWKRNVKVPSKRYT